MVKWAQEEPDHELTLWQYRAGKLTVVALAYMFGQHRLQVWRDQARDLPEILSPVF